jgi:hypothetical protein
MECLRGGAKHTSGVLVHIAHELPSFGRSEVDVIDGTVPAGMPIVNRPVPELKEGWPSASALNEPDRVSFAIMYAYAN